MKRQDAYLSVNPPPRRARRRATGRLCVRPSLLPFLVLATPILEIATFIMVGSRIGVLATLLLILATSLAGALLLRVQGLGTLARIGAQVDRGAVPDRELVHGAMILVAGVLLLLPGFLTDIVGLLLFIPPLRDAAWRLLRARIVVAARAPWAAGFGGRRDDDRMIELDPGQFRRTDPPRDG